MCLGPGGIGRMGELVVECKQGPYCTSWISGDEGYSHSWGAYSGSIISNLLGLWRVNGWKRREGEEEEKERFW